jgi:predicted aldo/keto reductase-like oxidoreductase
LEEHACREEVSVATKLPQYMVRKLATADRYFDEELRRLRTDYIDYYLMHMVTDVQQWRNLCALGIEEWIAQKKASGAIRHIGFSFHGNTDLFLQMLDAYDWDFCQIQYNYMDETTQAGRIGLQAAARKGIPVIIMEPLRGGKLAKLDPAYEAELKALRPEEEIPAWAFRFLQSIPSVTMILSGMSNEEQLEKNLVTFADEKKLNDAEMKALMSIADKMLSVGTVPCTACHYCVSHCPQGLDIPHLISLYNEHTYTGGGFIAPMALGALPEDKRPQACLGCRSCEQVCPQQIKISEVLAAFSEKLG